MVDISSQNNKINVTVSSSGNTANTNVTPDTAMYYSNKSKDWAISDRIVDNTDYSSKYYANESKKQADISTAKATEVIESGNTAVSNIENARDNAIMDVNTAGATQVALATEQATIATNKTSEVVASGNEALSNIDTAKNNAITSITNQETTSKNVLIDEGATQVGLVQQEGIARVEEILETGCIDIDYTEETSTLIFTGGGNALLSNYYTKEETDNLIPTNNNQLINGAGYITDAYHDNTKQDVITDLATIRSGASKGATALQSYTETDPIYTADKPNLATKTELQQGLNAKQDKGNYALKSEIPTKVSSLTNDKGYQTASDVAGMIASIPQFELRIVEELPVTGQKMVLYLVPKTSASGDNVYDEYIWIESTSSFELIGSTIVDLGDYYTKTETNTLLSGKQDKGNYAETNKANTFTQSQVITTETSGAILKLSSPAQNTNFILERLGGSQCVLESGVTTGLFGTKTNHPLQLRTGYVNRMTIGTDGSVVLASDVPSGSNSNQVATTKWTNNKLSAKLTGVSLTEDEYNALATKDPNTLYLIEE